MPYVRAALLYLGLAAAAVALGSLAPAAFLLPRRAAYRLMSQWNRFALWWARAACGIRYRVEGREHVPARGPYLVLSNHQSAFETILFVRLFPQPAFALKRSLLWLPFLGWGLAATRPIPIDRGAPVRSLRRLLERAGARFARGGGMVIFPEGERVPPGERRPFQSGGALLAVRHGVPVVPVAHNAGHCWPRAFRKRPGTITVAVGPPLDPAGLDADGLNRRVRGWIETAGAALDPPA